MDWKVGFSKQSDQFLETNEKLSREKVFGLIVRVIQKFRGEKVNVDVKKLTGLWEGFYRVRKGRLRIIVAFHFEKHEAHVEVIDWRGNVYK